MPLNTATPLCAIEHVWDLVDLLLVMTVDRASVGSATSRACSPRSRPRAEIDRRGLDVDGGIGTATIRAAAWAGATVF
nr:hypothetical protein [Pseudonocardia sp.]